MSRFNTISSESDAALTRQGQRNNIGTRKYRARRRKPTIPAMYFKTFAEFPTVSF